MEKDILKYIHNVADVEDKHIIFKKKDAQDVDFQLKNFEDIIGLVKLEEEEVKELEKCLIKEKSFEEQKMVLDLI